MNITIIGGGNIGTQFAVHCAFKGHDVTIYTNKFEQFSKELKIVDEANKVAISGRIKKATNNLKEAFSKPDIIFVTVPAFMMGKVANEIIEYIPKYAKIGLVPGTGGGECAFKQHIENGGIVFGLQRVPSVARLTEYGKIVCAEGYRRELFVSALPNNYSKECAILLQNIFDIRCFVLPNYLNITLTPSNPILHTTRLYSLFKNYKKGLFYNYIPLFYEEWDDNSSKLLIECDNELQILCKTFSEIDLSGVKSLKEHYESDTIEKMTKKICSIKSLQGLSTPSVKKDKGYLPDFNSRYFTADFPYGLAIIKQIAAFSNIKVPNIEKIWSWYLSIKCDTNYFNYKDFNINSLNDLKEFYLK